MDDLGVLSSLLGLGVGVAGQIPAMIPGQTENQLSQIAGGQGGAGQLAVRQATDQAARDTLSVAGSGRGATRGLQLREAIRQADRIRGEGVGRAASMAAQEQQSALANLERVRMARLQAITQGTAGLGRSLGELGAVASSNSGAAPTTPGAAPASPAGISSSAARGVAAAQAGMPAFAQGPSATVTGEGVSPARQSLDQTVATAGRVLPNNLTAQQQFIQSMLPLTTQLLPQGVAPAQPAAPQAAPAAQPAQPTAAPQPAPAAAPSAPQGIDARALASPGTNIRPSTPATNDVQITTQISNQQQALSATQEVAARVFPNDPAAAQRLVQSLLGLIPEIGN